MKKKSLMKEVKHFQKIAGLLKENEGAQWMSKLNPEVNGIEIYNDGDNRLFVIFDKNTGGIHVINDFNGEDFDEVWGTGEDVRPELLATIKKSGKMEDYHPDDPAGSDSAAARGEDDYEGEEEDALVRVIKFKKNNQDLGMFLNWLESYYTKAQTSDISTWDTDESFYFDPATLTLVLYNEEFDMEGNQEFHDYLQGLKSNILSIKS